MRIFYAAFLGAETARIFAELVNEATTRVPGVLRPIPSGSLHLTLAFLGEVPDGDRERCEEVLTLGQAPAAIPISLARPRVLFGRGQPRLILTDVVRGARAVGSIQEGLHASLSRRFPDKGLRPPKRPHATIARFEKGRMRSSGRRVEEVLEGAVSSEIVTEQTVVDISLVASTLSASGPIYEILTSRRLPLGGGA